jgi:uncharacterized protein (TIGR02996 family)
MSGGLGKTFLEEIVANIDEDTPRLAYADWLSENGREERAEFVRVQVERASLPAWDAAQVPLRLREAELLKKHGEEWLAEIPAPDGARWEGFRRGIVAEVSFKDFEAMRKLAHECRAVAPVEAVTVRWPRRREAERSVKPIAELRELSLRGMLDSEDAVEWLAESPQLATLRCLTTRGLWADTLETLAASPHLANLRVLRLPSNNFGNPGIEALVGAASLKSLEELDLSALAAHERYNYDPVIRAAGMDMLVGWAGLAKVRVLNLSRNDLTRDGLRALVRSPNAAKLKELSLRTCQLNGSAMAELDSASEKLKLESLDLGENVLKEVGAEYVAVVPCLGKLKALKLDRCEISLEGARLFAKKAKFLNGLAVLDVGHNHFRAAGLGNLLSRKPKSLHTLGLRDNDLYDEGAALLAGSPESNGLLEVDLSRNGLGAAAAEALGRSSHLRKLLVLRLTDNKIGANPAADLAASKLGRRLAVLELDNAPDAPRSPAPPPPGEDDGYGDVDDDEPIPF